MINVLLVDDEPLICEGMERLIDWNELGFTVSGKVHSGMEALECIEPLCIDLLITDLKMPVMSGIDLLGKVKERYPSVEVIVLTGFADFSYLQQCIRGSAADYLLKPINREELKQSLEQVKQKIVSRAFHYPLEIEEALMDAVTRGDENGMRSMSAQLFECFFAQKATETEIHAVIRNFLLRLIRYLDFLHLPLQEIINRPIPEDSLELFGDSRANLQSKFESLLAEVIIYKGDHSPHSTIELIQEYIRVHFNENLTLSGLACQFYLNPSYLSRVFKEKTGESFKEFLMRVRIEQACKLLQNSNFSIQKICLMIGFHDKYYFSRLFKNVTGHTPLEYRKMQQEEEQR